MNTDKLTMIDDDALDAVAGGGPGETYAKIRDARIEAAVGLAGVAWGAIEEGAGIMKGLMDDIKKALK